MAVGPSRPAPAAEPLIIEVHNSDRELFRRCRRKWDWQSRDRSNLTPIGAENKNFFFGSGIHFALEDFHGYHRWEHPAMAFAAYIDAHKRDELPDEIDELTDLGVGMLDYYQGDWLRQHPEPFETLVVDGIPQVEVEVAIDITDLLITTLEHKGVVTKVGLRPWLDKVLGDRRVHFVVTFDRVVIDKHERIWPLDYKTAAQLDVLNLQTNPQAGSYDWAADLFYGDAVEGLIWQQHLKAYPKPPNWLVTKNRFSTDASQRTTFALYRRTIMEHYGSIPEEYRDLLATLGNQQDADGDKFIKRNLLRRNDEQRRNEQEKIISEVLEMLDPTLPLYPNPTKDCSWDCSFKVPCLAKDDGSDYAQLLDDEYESWEGYKDEWRDKVRYPSASSTSGETNGKRKAQGTVSRSKGSRGRLRTGA